MDTCARQVAPTPCDDALVAAQETHVETDIVDAKEAIQSIDHDDAAELFAGTEDSFEYTDKEASWVRWKLDLILLTMVCLQTISTNVANIYS